MSPYFVANLSMLGKASLCGAWLQNGGFFVSKKVNKMKRNRKLKKEMFPKYRLTYVTQEGAHTYMTNIKSRLWRKLSLESKVERASFSIIYGQNEKNESIEYEFPKQRERFNKDFRTFSAKNEIEWMMKNL